MADTNIIYSVLEHWAYLQMYIKLIINLNCIEIHEIYTNAI